MCPRLGRTLSSAGVVERCTIQCLQPLCQRLAPLIGIPLVQHFRDPLQHHLSLSVRKAGDGIHGHVVTEAVKYEKHVVDVFVVEVGGSEQRRRLRLLIQPTNQLLQMLHDFRGESPRARLCCKRAARQHRHWLPDDVPCLWLPFQVQRDREFHEHTDAPSAALQYCSVHERVSVVQQEQLVALNKAVACHCLLREALQSPQVHATCSGRGNPQHSQGVWFAQPARKQRMWGPVGDRGAILWW
mmetsp:Transcript_173092/g.549550  ORF Transcript_173092/g.549550 Transcript_173092/m.549550 type:complete len:242 (-) Transcript_173092:74-799(-)